MCRTAVCGLPYPPYTCIAEGRFPTRLDSYAEPRRSDEPARTGAAPVSLRRTEADAYPAGPLDRGARQMEAVIFVGIQAAGKTTFYRERFFDTHLRINLDMLRTRHRERLLVRACIEAKQPFVVDNTNVEAGERARYIEPARTAGFRVVGFHFVSEVGDALRRNAGRTRRQAIPPKGLVGTFRRMEPPALSEGFDALWEVRIDPAQRFTVTAREG